MSQVVQASCPGCKSILRIPADWVGQPIRCKNCGTVLQTRTPVAPATPVVQTPPPPRTPEPTTPAPKRKIAAPPLPSGPARSPAPVVQAPIVTPPMAPMATPVDGHGSPFDFDEAAAAAEAEATSTMPRRRRKKGGSWVAPVAALVILAVTAGVMYGVYVRVIAPQLQAANQTDSDDENGASVGGGKEKNGKRGGAETGAMQFPRRAMVISVHNYLYANPIIDGPPGSANLERLINAMNKGLRIPLPQILHVSDAAKKDARPPLKSVIETSITNFLKTTRKQDRILLVLVGHTKEVEGEGYFVPLEGEMDAPATLVSFKWIFEQLKNCPARQKVLVLDGNRYNPAQGEERPAAGPMSEKMEAQLKAPPEGVQVLVACQKEQQSQEFEDGPLGLFLDSLRVALAPEKGQKGALEGKIQKADDLVPVDTILASISDHMTREIEKRKGSKQAAFMAGQPPADGAEVDRSEAPASIPALPIVKPGDLTLVKAIMQDITLPPIKTGEGTSSDVSFAMLPPFPQDVLKKYQGGDLPADHKLRAAVHEARVTLWSVSTAKPPAEIEAEVKALRGRLSVDLSVMRDRYGKPGAGDAETAFKARIFEDSKAMAPLVARLENALDKLREVGDEKENAPPRWQANYNFMLARLQAQLAFLEEYQGLLGQMRKDLPEHDANLHTGFRMASSEKANDATSKKLVRNARKIYDDIAKENAGTPWEVLSKREKLTALGLAWVAY